MAVLTGSGIPIIPSQPQDNINMKNRHRMFNSSESGFGNQNGLKDRVFPTPEFLSKMSAKFCEHYDAFTGGLHVVPLYENNIELREAGVARVDHPHPFPVKCVFL